MHQIFLVNSTVMSYVTCPLTQLKIFVFLVFVRFADCLIMLLHQHVSGSLFRNSSSVFFPDIFLFFIDDVKTYVRLFSLVIVTSM